MGRLRALAKERVERDEEDLVTGNESNGESRNEPGYNGGDTRHDASQDNDDDGASGIEAARAFLLGRDTASTSVSRQESVIATASQSSKTSLSSPEAQGFSQGKQTRSMDLDSETVSRSTKRQRTSLKGKQRATYVSPYPAIQTSTYIYSNFETAMRAIDLMRLL